MLGFDKFLIETTKASNKIQMMIDELDAMIFSNYVLIPLTDGKVFATYSSIISGELLWTIDGIWIKTNQYGYKRKVDINVILLDDQDTILLFRKINKLNSTEALKYITHITYNVNN